MATSGRVWSDGPVRSSRLLLAPILSLALVGGVAPAAVLAADPVVVGAGDIADCSVTSDSATAKLLDGIPGTVVALGDNAYPSGTAAQFRDCYGPTWGRHRSRTRPATGNHEYLTSGAAPYYAYFGAAAGDPTKGYYAYDLGAWHVVVLNSNCAAIGGCATTSPQGRWLQANLAAYPAKNVLAYWHHPLFSSGEHGMTSLVRPLWEILYAAGADVILNGHDHDYERFAPLDPWGRSDPSHGIREFVVGTGGAPVRARASTAPNSQTFSSTNGVLKLTLHATSYDWSFVPVAGKTFTDHGTASTHGRPATRTRQIFAATSDAFVDQAHPDTRYGGSARLLIDGDTGAGLDREAYLKVTVRGLGAGRVDRAALHLWITNPTTNGPTVAATSTSWTGATITWRTRPASTSPVASDAGILPAGDWMDLDVTSPIHGDGTYAFRIRPTSGDGLEASSLQGAHPPRLVIETVPAVP
jgi:hypothetical protein